jgi:hypothetical protein
LTCFGKPSVLIDAKPNRAGPINPDGLADQTAEHESVDLSMILEASSPRRGHLAGDAGR